jgi:hypothetical protein
MHDTRKDSAPLATTGLGLPGIFSEHMVLPKSDHVPVWGWAGPGEEITVTLGGESATAGSDRKWRVELNLAATGPGPHEMVVEGRRRIVLPDVLVGEVWLGSGQSNMEWFLRDTMDADEEIASSADPMLRQFVLAGKTPCPEPQDDCEGAWIVAGPGTSGGFSSVGYYFQKMLRRELNTPAGLLFSTWGGTPCEVWTSRGALESVPALRAGCERTGATAGDYYPQIREQFRTAFHDWLRETGREDREPADAAAYPNFATARSCEIPAALMKEGKNRIALRLLILSGEIRCPDKPVAGGTPLRGEWLARGEFDLALVARPLPATYDWKIADGETEPLVRNSPQRKLEGFAACGEDRKWVWADARIGGDTVVVRSENVPHPVGVRYAWQNNPTCNLFSAAGLPASPFLTDDFPGTAQDLRVLKRIPCRDGRENAKIVECKSLSMNE